MQSNQSNGHAKHFGVALTSTSDAKLSELAEESGLTKSKLAAHLLEELLPTVESVRTRLQITRKPTTAGSGR